MEQFKISGLSFSYPNEENKALKNINLEINEGEFVCLCGKSGSGKSTLLRFLKSELAPKGKKEGEILFFGKNEKDFTLRQSAESIGFLLQNTEYQTVTHCVRTELAFALENLGYDTDTIRLRIAEICAYFSLENIIDKKISELSGGQKQLVCLASIVVLRPKVIIFDEPTSQLDPMAAQSFLDTAKRLQEENGITIIITEHRLENVIPMADRVVFIENGEVLYDGKPENIDEKLFCESDFLKKSMPLPMRLHYNLSLLSKVPLTVSESKKELKEALSDKVKYTEINRTKRTLRENTAVEMKNIFFAYDKSGYVLKNMSLKIKEGSFTALMGANGAGKSTALSLMSGILENKQGKIKLFGKDIKKYKDSELYGKLVAVLPQKCESLFAGNTVLEDLNFLMKSAGLKNTEAEQRIKETASFCEISHLLNRHPFDLSGGEMQRAALCMVLLREPKIIFLDEPTKGMDNLFKISLAKKIKSLCEKGVTVVMVSHDTEFCGEYCDECAMIFDGECVTKREISEFFSQNFFYTTAANKVGRDLFPKAVKESEVLSLCRKNLQN